MYPEKVNKLVLEDPIGLEDYRVTIPFKSVDEMYALSLNPTWESILAANKDAYAQWDEKYAPYAEAAYRISLNPQYPKVAFINAVIYQMLYTQPVVYELEYLKVPTLIIYGDKDHVAPGKNFADKETQKTLGNYPVLSKNAAAKIPNAKLHAFANIGHVPHLEATQEFNQVLLDFIND
jgi:pimeloyl-ACP methyl ester carboxylesterase